VQCPKCKSPLTIPAPQAAPTAPQGFGAPAPQAGPSIFDDAGMRTFTPGKPICPECHAEMQVGAILCVKCGYNVQLGRKMRSSVKSAVGGAHGHEGAAQALLERAARTIDEDAADEKKKLKEGMPWWMLGAVFAFALTTCIMLLVLPPDRAIRLAVILTQAGVTVAQIYYLVLLIMIAFQDRPLHGILLIINPGFTMLYIVSRWEQTNHIFWGMIRVQVAGFLIGIFLGIAALIAFWSKKVQSELPSAPPPAAICHVVTFDYQRAV
jgi:hypothetical protein